MIKIVHCISDTNFGGAGRVLLNYLNHFDSNSFDITVVVPKGSKLCDYFNRNKYQVIEFDGMYDRSFDKKDVNGLVKIFKEISPDIVHSHGAFSARIAGKKVGARVVYTRHSVFDLPRWQMTFPGKILLGGINKKYADRIISVSPAASELLVNSGTPIDMIDVVFNGVEAVPRCTESEIFETKNAYKIPDGTFVCSIIARLEEVKGHKYVIQAAKILKDRGVNDICVLIAGAGGIESELKNYAKELGVTDIVRFVGFVKEIYKLLGVTDLQLNASFGTEATSMSLLEGFSLGIPAVVSDFGGNPYVVDHLKNGMIFAKKDANELCRSILRMKEDKSLYKNCVAGAKESFEQRFTAEAMTTSMERVYFDLLKERK